MRDSFQPTRFDAEPTDWRPGSAEKVDVMAERFAKGQPIFHDDDFTGLEADAKGVATSPFHGLYSLNFDLDDDMD
mgnify:CR=1 FL=1